MSAMCAVKRGSHHITPPLDAEYAVFDSAKLGVLKYFTKNISFSVLFITIPCILCVLDVFTPLKFSSKCVYPFRFDFVAKLHKVQFRISRPYLQMVHE